MPAPAVLLGARDRAGEPLRSGRARKSNIERCLALAEVRFYFRAIKEHKPRLFTTYIFSAPGSPECARGAREKCVTLVRLYLLISNDSIKCALVALARPGRVCAPPDGTDTNMD